MIQVRSTAANCRGLAPCARPQRLAWIAVIALTIAATVSFSSATLADSGASPSTVPPTAAIAPAPIPAPDRWGFEVTSGQSFTIEGTQTVQHNLGVDLLWDHPIDHNERRQFLLEAGYEYDYGINVHRRYPATVLQIQGGPNDRNAIRLVPMFRFLGPGHGKFAPLLDLGLGVICMNNPIRPDTGSDLNFQEQLGLGVLDRLDPSTSITLEYRAEHTSNLGLRAPNGGINAGTVVIGFLFAY